MIIILMEDASLLCETTEMRMTALQIRVQTDTPFYFKFHISNSFSRDICTLFSGDDDDAGLLTLCTKERCSCEVWYLGKR